MSNENWSLKIFTLGRFDIQKEGIPIHFAGKVQRKPLELLKAIISSGGRQTPADVITKLLWPNAGEDMAHQSLDTTLYRLRRLLENDVVVKLQGGQLTLDERYCWIDVQAFEQMYERIEALFRIERETGQENNGETFRILYTNTHPHPISASQKETVRLSGEIFSLYKGAFLPSDTNHFWTLSTRERLRNKFIRFIIMLGNCFEQLGQWQTAAEHYQTAIEIDGFTEEFYQHLMVCHHQLDQCAKAIGVYQRLKNTFSEHFGIKPSKTTEAIYNALISENK